MAEVKLFDAIEKLRYENSQYHTQNFDEQKRQSKSAEDLTKTVGELLAEFKGARAEGRLDAEEARRESGKEDKPDKTKPDSDKSDLPSFELKGILQILAGIGASVAGFAVGLVQGFGNIVKLATKAFRARIANIFKPFSRFIDAIADVFGKRGTGQILKGNTYKSLGRLTGMFRSFADGIKNLETRFADTLKKLKNFGALVKSYAGAVANTVKGVAKLGIDKMLTTIRSGMTSISAFFKSVAGFGNFADVKKSLPDLKAFKALKDTLNAKIVKPFQNFINGIRGVGKSTSVLGKTLARFFGAFKVIGRFVAFPLTIIMGVIDGFKGLMAGSERQVGLFNKLIGGAIGAITGVLKGLVAMPLDLLKDGISWIAGKLGFENFSKMLDSFSFGEMFQMVGDRIADGFVKFFDGLVYVVKNAWTGLMKPFENGFSLGAITEFIVTLPHKLSMAFLDLVKNGVSALLSIFGAEDAAKELDSFSFTDTFEDIIDYVKELPGKLIDSLLGLFEGFDISAALGDIGDFATAAMNQLKQLIRSILPDPESMLAKVIPDALYEWTDTPPPPPPKPVEQPAAEVPTEVPMTEEKPIAGTENVNIGEKFTDQFGEERQYEYKVDPAIAAKIKKDNDEFFAEMDRLEGRPLKPDVTPRTSNGQELSEKSKENEQSKGSANVAVINAPQQSSVTNNNQSTAAIIDQNLPTVDYNDRSFSYA